MGLLPLRLPLVSPPTLPLPPSISLVLTLLPPPLLPEATLLPDAMSPTLPELSMLPRGRLRLRLMLMLTPTCTTADSDTLDMADTLDTDTLVCHTPDTDTPSGLQLWSWIRSPRRNRLRLSLCLRPYRRSCCCCRPRCGRRICCCRTVLCQLCWSDPLCLSCQSQTLVFVENFEQT